VFSPSSSLVFLPQDACLHVPIAQYGEFHAVNVSYLAGARDDRSQVFSRMDGRSLCCLTFSDAFEFSTYTSSETCCFDDASVNFKNSYYCRPELYSHCTSDFDDSDKDDPEAFDSKGSAGRRTPFSCEHSSRVIR